MSGPTYFKVWCGAAAHRFGDFCPHCHAVHLLAGGFKAPDFEQRWSEDERKLIEEQAAEEKQRRLDIIARRKADRKVREKTLEQAPEQASMF